MSWLRLDDAFPDHPKVAALSDAAFRAHVTGMAYCARHLTDGFIPERKGREIAGDALDELMSSPRNGSPLWISVSDGYEIHAYLEYNPSREDVDGGRKLRAEAGKKGAASRWNGKSHGKSHSKSHGKPMPRTPNPEPNTHKDKTLSPSAAVENLHDEVLGYWIGKTDREPSQEELRSLAVLCKRYGPGLLNLAIGQAVAQGERPNNFALITTIAKAEANHA